jgi:hypothetical protein
MLRRGFDSPRARQRFDDVGKTGLSRLILSQEIVGSNPTIVTKFAPSRCRLP